VSDFNHAIVWIDHSEATVARFRGTEESDVDVHSHTSLQRLHHGATGWEAGGNVPEDIEFFRRILGNLDPNGDVVITGPGNAKGGFKAFLDLHRPDLSARLILDDVGDQRRPDALRALGRRYFTGAGASLSQGEGRID